MGVGLSPGCGCCVDVPSSSIPSSSIPSSSIPSSSSLVPFPFCDFDIPSQPAMRLEISGYLDPMTIGVRTYTGYGAINGVYIFPLYLSVSLLDLVTNDPGNPLPSNQDISFPIDLNNDGVESSFTETLRLEIGGRPLLFNSAVPFSSVFLQEHGSAEGGLLEATAPFCSEFRPTWDSWVSVSTLVTQKTNSATTVTYHTSLITI